jgi:glycerol-3-phosphate responsive antiterminator
MHFIWLATQNSQIERVYYKNCILILTIDMKTRAQAMRKLYELQKTNKQLVIALDLVFFLTKKRRKFHL